MRCKNFSAAAAVSAVPAKTWDPVELDAVIGETWDFGGRYNLVTSTTCLRPRATACVYVS